MRETDSHPVAALPNDALDQYASYGGGLIVGRIVRLTSKGRTVSCRQRAITAPSASGVGCVSAVRIPSPPALETAAASSAVPTHCMPPCTIGTAMPSLFVIWLLIVSMDVFVQDDSSKRKRSRRTWHHAAARTRSMTPWRRLHGAKSRTKYSPGVSNTERALRDPSPREPTRRCSRYEGEHPDRVPWRTHGWRCRGQECAG